MQEIDVQLIKRCQQGDKDAFFALIKHLEHHTIRTAYLLTGHRELAADITQEAFIQCYRKIGNLRNPEAFPAWFYQLLRRIAWRLYKKERRYLAVGDSQNVTKLAPNPTPETQGYALYRDTGPLIQQALAQLNPKLREVIILRYYNDLPLEELARILNCRIGTVKSRLHRAKKQLSSILKESDGREQAAHTDFKLQEM